MLFNILRRAEEADFAKYRRPQIDNDCRCIMTKKNVLEMKIRLL